MYLVIEIEGWKENTTSQGKELRASDFIPLLEVSDS